MTFGRLRARMRKMREDAEDEEMESGELNLVPYLDIVTNVIMFLMMTTTFAAALGSINVSSPTILPPGPPVEKPVDVQPELHLTLQISDQGYTLATSHGVFYAGGVTGKVPTIPKRGGEYDNAWLAEQMRLIKNQEPGETRVIVNADPGITYESVVGAMDSIRQDPQGALFPDVALSTGMN